MPQEITNEHALHAWKKILKIEDRPEQNPDMKEDHSAIILKIATRLGRLGYHIKENDLIQFQKIDQQSKFLITSLKLLNAAKEAQFVIPIQTGGNNFPIFGFPDLLLYCNIGYHLRASQPFYSIEKSCYEKDNEVISHYLAEIRNTKPKGPYGLIGYCRWGSIAVEMAHTLLAQGEKVPLLVLIEYYSEDALIPRTSKKFLGSKIKSMVDNFRKNLSYKSKGRYVLMECYYGFFFVYKSLRGLVSKQSKPVIKTYPGKVVLIRASEAYGVKDDPFMGWKGHFTGDVECFKVDGEHLDIMLEPYAAQIARILNDVSERENQKLKDYSVVDFRMPMPGIKRIENVL